MGDVVQVATQHTSRDDGHTYWWRRFCVVTKVYVNGAGGPGGFACLHLKLNPDMDKDDRTFWLGQDGDDRPLVVTWLAPERWPQGINAIYMKLLTKGVFKL